MKTKESSMRIRNVKANISRQKLGTIRRIRWKKTHSDMKGTATKLMNSFDIVNGAVSSFSNEDT